MTGAAFGTTSCTRLAYMGGVAMTTRYSNATANQHYISQVEQRLNARNPKAKLGGATPWV
jgi:hypothetical protein